VDETLLGEKREIYPFLGSYLLAEAIDSVGADAAFHGHAHHGIERGTTPGGVPVRNVALNVIRHAYNIYTFEHPVARIQAEPQGNLDPALPNRY
jgi:Icc-related predicted phosphoesterase